MVNFYFSRKYFHFLIIIVNLIGTIDELKPGLSKVNELGTLFDENSDELLI